MGALSDPRRFLRQLFDAALEAAQPAHCLPGHLPPPPKGRTIVVGAGKAAASMAEAVEAHWPEARLNDLSGLVITRYGHGAPTRKIEVVEAGHPLPDANGQLAGAKILSLVHGLSPDDLVLCLISGGGSALLALPVADVPLSAKQAVTRSLLMSGATIGEINCVRKHLSAIKGGKLALAAMPARIVSLIISDVPGDDPAIIASGPTVPDPSTREQALDILARYRIVLPPSVRRWLLDAKSESPKPGDAAFGTVENIVIARAQDALEAAAATARKAGVTPVILGDALEGEARDVAKVHAAIARQVLRHGQPAAPPCVILSGGETTVTVKGKGRGGRNVEFLLALALALQEEKNIWALACDTDGIDGTENNAGAVLTPDTLTRAAQQGLKPSALLDDNDAWSFFHALGDLIETGPTRTNVNDFRAIAITHPSGSH